MYIYIYREREDQLMSRYQCRHLSLILDQGCQGQGCQGQVCQGQGCQGQDYSGWIRAMGLIYGGMPYGRTTWAGLGWWDWFMGACHGGTQHWLDRGVGIDSWGLAMGTHGTCWIREMGLIYGGVQHWLERGDGIDSWGLAMGACDSGWIGVMGLIYGGVAWGRAARAGSGRLHWFMGMRHRGVRLDRVMGLIGGVHSFSQPPVHPCFARAIELIAHLKITQIPSFSWGISSKKAFCTP